MTTANREYEALTTVEAVQKALDDDRVVECVPPGDSHQWLQTFMDKPEVIASDLMAGWQYRAPAASVGDAPSDAVAASAYFSAEVVHEMMQMAYRAALPPTGNQLRCANQVEAADTILAMEASRAILTAPPAAPVVSDAPPIPTHLIGQCESLVWAAAWELSAKHHAALSVPATDDKAPAVDAMVASIPKGARVVGATDDYIVFVSKNGGEDQYAYFRAAPTSPHDVDAVRVDEATVERACAAAVNDLTAEEQKDWEKYYYGLGDEADDLRIAMRRALTAALRKLGEG